VPTSDESTCRNPAAGSGGLDPDESTPGSHVTAGGVTSSGSSTVRVPFRVLATSKWLPLSLKP
jgi:hypothetical protein